MYDHTFFLCLLITRADIRPHIKGVVTLMFAGGHYYLQCKGGYFWWHCFVCLFVCLSVIPLFHRALAHPLLVGSKVYFFWSPTEDYCVTV